MANEKNLRPPFQKGNKAAVGHGRPKGSRSLVTRLREAMEVEIPIKDKETGKIEKRQIADLFIQAVIKPALKGDVRNQALIFDRVEGKPVQSIESHTKLDLRGMNLSSLSNEQLEKLIQDNTANDD
jgi:hypothetical protein